MIKLVVNQIKFRYLKSSKNRYLRRDYEHIRFIQNKTYPLRIPNEMQEKVKIIAKKEKRKISQQYELIVKEYLNNYEKTHGEIATGKSPGGQENNGN